MKSLFLFCCMVICGFIGTIAAQDNHPNLDYFHKNVEKNIDSRRFGYEAIEPSIEKLKHHSDFKVELLGQSVEGRPIQLVSWGTGEESILMWSQMHGDEPTATMAMMDLFNFLMEEQDERGEALKATWKESLSLYFIPMLNPDGAHQFRRHNAMGIDINRDALKLNTPEGRALKAAKDRLQPDWGFNLHDQSRYYQAGHQPYPATFSFLAPAYNEAKDINGNRMAAMQLIVALNELAQSQLPGQVGRYDDTFEPRAFGDNMQKWGVRTILIECGGNPADFEKQDIRKNHFLFYLHIFDQIINQSYQQYALSDYEAIPFNRRRMMELVVRNADYTYLGQHTHLDFGYQFVEYDTKDHRSGYVKGSISEIGDLTGYQGYQELDASDLVLEKGKLYPNTFKQLTDLTPDRIKQLHRAGYTAVKLKNLPPKAERYNLPIQLRSAKTKQVDNEIKLYGNPAFVLRNQADRVVGVIVNGVYYPTE